MDLKVLYNNTYEEHSYKQIALQNKSLLIELIESEYRIIPSEFLEDKPRNVRLGGFLKVGFRVVDFDMWYERAQQNGVNFYGRVVDDPVSGKRIIIMLDPDCNRI